MSVEKDVKTLPVASSEDALVGKAILTYDPATGEPSAFDASAMFKGAKKWYGVEFYTGTMTNPSFTAGQVQLLRIGNADMHRELPVQSLMRGCLLNDDGTVREYLQSNGWNAHDLSGASGQVMVEIPGAWWLFEDDLVSGTTRRRAAKVSLEQFPGATYVPKFYIGAYEASLSGSKLCSVADVLPKTAYSRTSFRTAARARNNDTKWNILSYDCYRILFWLYMIEYANRNSQAAVNSQRDANGFRQGGLGTGISNVSNWEAYNGYCPIVKTGRSNSLGNDSGEVNENASSYVNNGVTLVTSDGLVHNNRYRGIENPFGHIWKWVDGIIVNAGASAFDFYATSDPTKFSDSSFASMEKRGSLMLSSAYPKTLVFGAKGDIMPAEGGGGSTSYWCDYGYMPSAGAGISGVYFGGSAGTGAYGGFACSNSLSAPSSADSHIGSRLCYIP